MCTAPQEALLGGKSCSRLLEGMGGEGSPGLADEHDKAWEMAGLLGQVWLKKEPLSLSTLPQTLGGQEDRVSLCKHKDAHGGKQWEKGRSKSKTP